MKPTASDRSISAARPLLRCLACGQHALTPYFDMKAQSPANWLREDRATAQPKFPLGLVVCPMCFHSQNLVSVDRRLLFAEYPYVSGTSRTLLDYFDWFVMRVQRDFGDRKLRVLDIACNDGSLLAAFKQRGHEVLGVDPALNLKPLQERNDVAVLRYPWEMCPESLLGGKFDVIIAMNVLAHVESPVLFLRLARNSLRSDGRIYVQTSQADMVKNCEFDTVYHEHLSFFTGRSFGALAARAGLRIAGLDIVPIHGNSYLVQFRNGTAARVTKMARCKQEEADGLYDMDTYELFASRAAAHVDSCREMISNCAEEGFDVYGYGAAAKAITFLADADITLEAIVDDNPLKIGKWLPGQDTQIIGGVPNFLPKVVWVIGAWNIAPELVAKIKAARPGKPDMFLCVFPSPKFDFAEPLP